MHTYTKGALTTGSEKPNETDDRGVGQGYDDIRTGSTHGPEEMRWTRRSYGLSARSSRVPA